MNDDFILVKGLFFEREGGESHEHLVYIRKSTISMFCPSSDKDPGNCLIYRDGSVNPLICEESLDDLVEAMILAR